MTQEQLAAAAGISKRDVERYEGGMSPRGDTFLVLLTALGLEVEGMPQGPKAINAELADVRREMSALRRSIESRLESVEAALAEKADGDAVRRGLEAVRAGIDALADPRTDEAAETP